MAPQAPPLPHTPNNLATRQNVITKAGLILPNVQILLGSRYKGAIHLYPSVQGVGVPGPQGPAPEHSSRGLRLLSSLLGIFVANHLSDNLALLRKRISNSPLLMNICGVDFNKSTCLKC